MRIDLVGGFYEDATKEFDSQRCINWFPVYSQSGNSKNKLHLVGDPGYQLEATVTPQIGTGCRGLHSVSNDDRLFGVWGNSLFEIDSAGVVTDRNPSDKFTYTSSENRVSIADDGTNMVIIDNGDGYHYNLTSEVITTIGGSFPSSANQVVWHNNYFIVTALYTKKFYWSSDGITWNALDFASIVSSPDDISGLIRTNTDIWLFGEKSMEAWRYTGSTINIFQRVPGATHSVGTKNPWATAKIGDVVYFLANNKQGFGTVMRTNGYSTPEMVSTDAINEKIKSIGDTTTAIAYTYQEKGHSFYQLTIPTLGITLVYNHTNGQWHEKAFWNVSTDLYEEHKSSYQAFAYGLNYIAYDGDDNLYYYDSSYYYDNTDVIRRLATGAHNSMENKLIKVNRVELEFARGQGTATGAGSDPQVAFNLSFDGGHTWGNDMWESVGQVGEYSQRAVWHALGSGRDMVPRIIHVDPCKSDIIDMYADIKVLRA